MVRWIVPAALLLAVAACVTTPMRWEKPGVTDPGRDEAECRATAREEAAHQLPYGDGPPLYGLTSDVSMLQWKMAIDNERYYVERNLTATCMQNKGFHLAPVEPVNRA